MKSINISVITSLYRCEDFLVQYLQHASKIINLSECEFILVHNDPTEEEYRILESFKNQSINIVHLTVKREGLYSSWNRGIRTARGKYIAIWNVDDIRSPDSLLSQKIALENSDAVMCYGDFYGTNRYGEYKQKLYEMKEFDHFRKESRTIHIVGCFPMWNKNIHDKVEYLDEQFKIVSDYEFQLRVALNYRLVKADSILGYYLENADHKLSRNEYLHNKERTVVEIRYRLYDRVQLHFVPFIAGFRIKHFLNFGKWVPVAEVVPSLNKFEIKKAFLFSFAPFSYLFSMIKRISNALYRLFIQ
jgi:glycosyltransferase involved in cell wall biosynthesis